MSPRSAPPQLLQPLRLPLRYLSFRLYRSLAHLPARTSFRLRRRPLIWRLQRLALMRPQAPLRYRLVKVKCPRAKHLHRR